MPLMKHKIQELAELLHILPMPPSTLVIDKKKLAEKIEEYFKDKIVVIYGPGDIQSVAADMDLHLADDEIEFLAKQIQDEHDCERGISWPNIENEVEKWYLEDTENGDRRNCPDFVVVKIDETKMWSEKFLTKHAITKMSGIYLLDKCQHSRCCEGTPSYCLYFIENCPEVVCGAQVSDEVDEEIRAQPNENVTYIHVSAYEKAGHEESSWRPIPLTTDMYEDEEAYEEMVDELMGDYHDNPVW